ncbi:MAG: hypothetical protein B5M53_02370 [Candidatus Cloacimonas sp. 4484_209]|nr:MAG: hypothetical protein B5M53_02370 [Candidatus Cloacimonas sp. 4484_209]
MKRKEALLDFGTIVKDTNILSNTKSKRISLTIYSNSDWILLAKPTSDNPYFSKLFTDRSSPISYSVKTKQSHNNNKFFPFIKDEYIIIASGEKTSKEGEKIEVELKLNDFENLSEGTYSANIDFVLLTKDKYENEISKIAPKVIFNTEKQPVLA